jgi:hypothetical protein
MEIDGSILNSTHFVMAVTLANQFDPMAIKREQRYTRETALEVYVIMRKIFGEKSTNLESFKNYIDCIATDKAIRGRWRKYIPELNKLRMGLMK